jgi:hypothetical protein
MQFVMDPLVYPLQGALEHVPTMAMFQHIGNLSHTFVQVKIQFIFV